MSKKFIYIVLMLVGVNAFAQEDEQPVTANENEHEKSSFQMLDSNSDGVIDQMEAKADKNLDQAFLTIAKQGKIEPKTYMEWKRSEAKKKS